MNITNELYASAGHYLPSFFKMEVLTEESLVNIDEISESAARIYFHEYVHYIQDVSTFHGLSNMIRMGEYIHNAINIAANSDYTFRVPVDISRITDTIEIIKILAGDQFNSAEDTIKEVEYIAGHVKAFHGQTVPEVLITTKNGITYKFGSWAIMESMANIAEFYLFQSDLEPMSFPYRCAELVARFIFPEFAANILNIFALCDLALLTPEPGPSFVKKLSELKKADYKSDNPKHIYKFFENEVYDFDGFKVDRLSNLSALVARANIYLSGYFPDAALEANVNWMFHVTRAGYSLRNFNIAFPLDILLHGTFYNNPVLKHTMRYIGSPLMLNMNDRAVHVVIEELGDSNFQPDLNWAIAEVQKVFLGKNEGCKLKSFCKESAVAQNIPDFTNELCLVSPWKRASRGQNCSFVTVLKMWGLENKEPIFK